MFWRTVGVACFLTTVVVLVGVVPRGYSGQQDKTEKKPADDDKRPWTEEFGEAAADLVEPGRNPYFILQPGYYMVLKKGDSEVTKAVFPSRKKVDGIWTRVVEEKETTKGKVVEISRNYYAISKRTNSVYYFGKDVDIYKDGKVVSHDGAWLAGVKGAKYGLMMPGTPLLGGRYYREIAPKVASDRAEIVGMNETVETPAGTFKNCLKVEETTPLEPGKKEYKYYAPGIGLVKDGKMELVKHYFANRK